MTVEFTEQNRIFKTFFGEPVNDGINTIFNTPKMLSEESDYMLYAVIELSSGNFVFFEISGSDCDDFRMLSKVGFNSKNCDGNFTFTISGLIPKYCYFRLRTEGNQKNISYKGGFQFKLK